MASTFDAPFYRHSPLSVDTQHKFFDEDDSILEDGILDPTVVDSSLEMSPPDMDSRRESFAVGQPLFSPKPEDWSSVDMQSLPSNNSFLNPHQSNPFAQTSPSNGFVSHNGNTWPMSTSGMATPMHAFDSMSSAFDANTSLSHRPAQTPFSNPSNQVPLYQPVGAQSIPASPQQDQWMGQSTDMSRKSSQTGVAFRTSQELRRGDGIRKKNARFDIPRERTLSTIDRLISQSKDEHEIKELKQQKRLLRNRQAALDSRQRKKQHTERLEDEKKAFTLHIGELEDEIETLRHRVDSLMQDNQNYNLHVEKLKFDKEEMIQSHTIETGELRKKIGVLTNHIQTIEASPMQNTVAVSATALPQSTGYGGHFTEMDGITMDGSWETMNFLNDYAVEPVEIKQETIAAVPAKKPELSLVPTNEKPAVQSGLLCMLFLVGAFVLSSRQTPSIPRVSEDVRLASATLLDNVLKDAGLPQTAAGLQAAAPQPSASSWMSAQAVRSGMAGLNGADSASILGGLSDSLTQPSMAQTNDQLFSLSADQYNGVASPGFLPHQHPLGDHQQQTSQNRRNLADALASMQNGPASKADVYTRSLLWDQIPSEVVRTFAKMVSECNSPIIDSDTMTTRE